MIPSDRWFPTNIAARAAFFNNFNIQFPTVSASLDLAAFDVQVQKDAAVYEFVADVFNQLKSFEDAVRQYRKIVTEGDIGDTEPQFPANPNFVHPGTVTTGIFERLDKLRTKIMAADNYTDEIGALLGILVKSPDSLIPAEVKPTIQTSAAQSGYMFSVVVSNRGDSDMWDALTLKKGGTWTKAASFTGKSGDITVSPTNAGEPEQIQFRVQLRKNNQNYGQPSDIVYVTVNP